MAGCLRSHCLAWSGCANVLRDKWTLGCDRATFGFLQCSTQEGWLWGQRRLDGGRRGGASKGWSCGCGDIGRPFCGTGQ